ncbi:MAG: ribonuclease Y [Candidatus Margulisbacteria bacterium GWF2_35_9]|nr:MAG: ribonuclease Y [Candidatus Margulisbacteria bacterium GWF2_35_9]
MLYIVIAIVILLLAFGYFLFIKNHALAKKENETNQKINRLLKEAERKAEDVRRESMLQAKEEMLKIRNDMENELKERRDTIVNQENRLLQKEEHLETREANLELKISDVEKKNEYLSKQQLELESIYQQQIESLEKVALLNQEDAKKMLLDNLEREVKYEAAKMIKETEELAQKTSLKKAREIIATAVQRCAVDNVVEITTSVVALPNDEMKGRIIGREGRNIRAFETLTGIDLIIDDTPETVVLSGFDPIRREIARKTLGKLVQDGRIHPTRIEEVYEQAKKELEATIIEIGEQTALDTDVQNLSQNIIYLLGRLNFRTSYGQNVLQHSIEVAHIASLMAQELNVNVRLARRAGLLHDIGKAIDFEKEGTHAALGAEFANRNGENEEVVHAILAHHEEIKPQTIESIIVAAADAISASRPGARRESIEAYIKRLETLENLAVSFNGVEKAFAIQSGREIRVMVKPDIINDKLSSKLARDIVKKIESELEYPGTIKVTVIRETRVQDVAK